MNAPALYRRRDVPVFIYAIQPVGIDRVKVGLTDNLERRITHFSSMSPVPLEWRRVLMVFGRGAAHVWERNVLAWAPGGYAEWRDDIGAVDDLMAEIAPAVDVTAEAPVIMLPRRGVGAGLSPSELDAAVAEAARLDLAALASSEGPHAAPRKGAA